MNMIYTECWQRNDADKFRANAVECYEIAERHSGQIKEQYEALARQWLMIAAQRLRAA
ncbi:MAG TPA: hypothetical protein VKD43_12870 [Xanthobacteraceae bacterium]|nr:hypothetical protein [Xanthobacteraceae bacterium]